MEDIRIYDFGLRLLHIVHDIQSVYWTLSFREAGTFEGTIPKEDSLVSLLLSHPYLLLVQGDLQAVITAKSFGDVIHLYGKTPNWFLTKRILPPLSSAAISDKGFSTVARYLFETAFSGEVFSFKDESGITEEFDIKTEVARSLSSILEERLKGTDVGYMFSADVKERRWVLRFYRGKALPYVFSEENRNIKNATYREDIQDYATSAYVKVPLSYQGSFSPYEGIPDKPKVSGAYYRISYKSGETEKAAYPNGQYWVCDEEKNWGVWEALPLLYDKAEIVPEVGDLSEDFLPLMEWDSISDAESVAEAKRSLVPLSETKTAEGTATGCVFGKDYGLGDTAYVTCIPCGGVYSQKKRICGVEIWAERDNVGEKMIWEDTI